MKAAARDAGLVRRLGTWGLAASIVARSNVALAGMALNFRWLGFAATVGIAGMLATIALGSRMEILGLLVLVGISTAVYLLQTRLAPALT